MLTVKRSKGDYVHSGFRISSHMSFIVNSNHIVSESYTKIPTKRAIKNENCQFFDKSENFYSIEKKVYLRSNRTPNEKNSGFLSGIHRRLSGDPGGTRRRRGARCALHGEPERARRAGGAPPRRGVRRRSGPHFSHRPFGRRRARRLVRLRSAPAAGVDDRHASPRLAG